MGKIILGILVVAALQIAFVTYITQDAPADITARVVNTNADGHRGDLSSLNDLNKVPISADSTAFKAVMVANRRNEGKAPIRLTMSQNQRMSARAASHRPRVRNALRPRFDTYVRREFFGRMVVEITYGIASDRAKNILRTKKCSYLA